MTSQGCRIYADRILWYLNGIMRGHVSLTRYSISPFGCSKVRATMYCMYVCTVCTTTTNVYRTNRPAVFITTEHWSLTLKRAVYRFLIQPLRKTSISYYIDQSIRVHLGLVDLLHFLDYILILVSPKTLGLLHCLKLLHHSTVIIEWARAILSKNTYMVIYYGTYL